ncbi:MAG: capsule biosynthesis protein [Rhodobacteraceae bacterium]|nr:MAG: capsule biosynthesis protein [Paracoccaceae bacterium]
MTTPIKPKRFRLRRSAQIGTTPASPDTAKADEARPSAKDRPAKDAATPALDDKSQGSTAAPSVVVARKPKDAGKTGGKAPASQTMPAKEPPEPHPAHGADLEAPAKVEDTIESIRAEGLTARQLRMAMRVAQKHGIRPSSAYEAVLVLRQRGVDPFARATLLELVEKDEKETTGRALAPRADTAPAKQDEGDPVSAAKERMARIAAERERELKKVRREIVKRRRKRMALLGARLLVFVTLPTFLATWYFYVIATPMYGTESQFIIQQADSQGGVGAMGGLLPSAAGMGIGGQSEAASVQAFLQSRAAMRRLDAEEGFKEHFSQPEIDILRRLSEDASSEDAFRLYQRHVQIGYDPTEGVVRLEVIAASPEDSERFSRALIRYAEEQVDMMTQRLRDSQLGEARASLEEAQQQLIDARTAVVELQEQSSVLSSEVEVSLISQQIAVLDAELTQTRLSLQEWRSNPRPNPARVQPLERREEALRQEIDDLRNMMTRGTDEGTSLARIQSQLIMAEAEVQTREMMRAQAMQQLENARLEVSRQVRYLALSVEPVAPDQPTYPRKLENSALAFLIFLGIYLFMSMTASVLREQISG